MKHTLYVLAVFAISFTSCKKKVEPSCNGTLATYENDIKVIIDANCTSSNCHGAGSPRGDWTSYNGMKTVLNNGQFKKRVLTKQNMPQGGSLSNDELNLIQCWADNNYAEN